MALRHFTIEGPDEGIVTAVWNNPERSMNLITADTMADLGRLVAMVTGNDAIIGAIIISAKQAFSPGADLAGYQRARAAYEEAIAIHGDEAKAGGELLAKARGLSDALRALETCGKPFVAALGGLAYGGGLEVALACHYRVAVKDARLALPEALVGLLPGAGGTQRAGRMMGPEAALDFMNSGKPVMAEDAVALGLVDEIAAPANLLKAARKWIVRNGDPVRAWDKDGYRPHGGHTYSPAGMARWIGANALYRKSTFDNYPAQRAIMSCVHEGLVLPMDRALDVEARYFTKLLRGQEAQGLIRTNFFSRKALDALVRRPVHVPETKLKKIAVLGAGMMGAGIAQAAALSGLEVALLDLDKARAEAAKAAIATRLEKAVKSGRLAAAQAKKALALVRPAATMAAIKDAGLIIEAVFEDRRIKAEVIAAAQKAAGADVVFGSNTSTLPITGLAALSADPERFIGIHFFSPVEKMQLVEIIRGAETGDEALAVALDFVRRIAKTPIVVNDGRGFYASRVVATYIDEGHFMLQEGIPAAMIENAGKIAGMPVGPLALNDEVALDLTRAISLSAKADLGVDYVVTPRDRILEEMVVTHGRFGRKNAKGFYDYPKDAPKRLWPGIDKIVGEALDPDGVDVGELVERFLTIQALETARCMEEGIVTDPREADVGAVLGWGFAPHTGGPAGYIDLVGAEEFVARCTRFAKRHGKRFAPNTWLSDLAAAGAKIYRPAGNGL